jgi:hypothetical protein
MGDAVVLDNPEEAAVALRNHRLTRWNAWELSGVFGWYYERVDADTVYLIIEHVDDGTCSAALRDAEKRLGGWWVAGRGRMDGTEFIRLERHRPPVADGAFPRRWRRSEFHA